MQFTSHFFSSAGREAAALGASQGSGLEPEPQGTFAPLTFGYLMRRLLTLIRRTDGEKLLHKVFRAPALVSQKSATSLPGYVESLRIFLPRSKLVPEVGWF